jgi:predicted nucleic acid-binding protein
VAKLVKLYWDSCAWLGLLNGEADKKRELEIVYSHAKKGHYEIWTSTISMTEVRHLKDEKSDPKPLSQENLRIISNIFRQPFVKPIPVAVDIAEHARELIRTTPGLGKWQDAIHLASALRWNIPMLHTYDSEDLIHLSARFQCRNGERLLISYPDETTDGPLFAKTTR